MNSLPPPKEGSQWTGHLEGKVLEEGKEKFGNTQYCNSPDLYFEVCVS